MSKYENFRFGYEYSRSEADTVKCPQLTSFMDDLISLSCEYGIGFQTTDRGYNNDRRYDDGIGCITIVPFKQADWDLFVDDLEEYKGGIPWLDKARDEYKKKVAVFLATEMHRIKTRDEAIDKAKFVARLEQMKERGEHVVLKDGTYCLCATGSSENDE